MIARQLFSAAGLTAAPPEADSLVDFLLWHARVSATRIAAKQKVNGVWRDYTWAELGDRVRRLSEGLVKLGIQPGDRVAIYANPCLSWCLMDLAIEAARAVPTPIYPSNTPEEVAYIVNDSEVKLVCFDHGRMEGKVPGRWARLQTAAPKMPTVQRFLSFEQPSDEPNRLMGMGELEQLGAQAVKENPRGLEERAKQIKSDDLNCILYTSGTTGQPKGVMLTHGGWVYQAYAIGDVRALNSDDVMLLFLPLAHSFGRVFEAAWLCHGYTMAFAEAVEKAVDNAAEVRATVMPAVPRVFEKAYSKVTSDGAAAPGVKGRLFTWAMKLFEEYAAARMAGRDYNSAQWLLARRLVFSKVAERLKTRFGGRMRTFVSGGAPLSRKIAFFFDVCGLMILEGYGLTETCAPTHVNRPGNIRIGTVGPPFTGTLAKVASDGEVLLKGPQVMRGYHKLPAETAEVLDPDGWFHTGDIGEIDVDGFLRITDRKKDLIKTSGGKYIAPQELENALKTEPLVSQVAVLGDRRRFVSALFTLNEENLTRLATELKLPQHSYADLSRRPEVRARLQQAVDVLNARLPSYATIKRFSILDADWTVQTGELTPKLSVKRKVVAERYKAVIDAMYEGESFD